MSSKELIMQLPQNYVDIFMSFYEINANKTINTFPCILEVSFAMEISTVGVHINLNKD